MYFLKNAFYRQFYYPVKMFILENSMSGIKKTLPYYFAGYFL